MKKILIWVLGLLLLFQIPFGTALCCGDVCRPGGFCDLITDTWYEGCMDSSGQVYGPNQKIPEPLDETRCGVCKCTDSDNCEWKLDSTTCQTVDTPGYICVATANTIVGYSNAECVDPDDAQVLCETNACSLNQWLPFGEDISKSVFFPLTYQPNDGSTTDNIIGCCGDDSNEHIIFTTIDTTTLTACCDDDAGNRCIDEDGLCQKKLEESATNPLCKVGDADCCDDGIDNDCNGIKDTQEPGCCGDQDNGESCCQSPNAFNSFGKCCGDDTDDVGKISNDLLCSFNTNTKEFSWVPSSPKGIIYFAPDALGGHDMVSGSWLECNSEDDSLATPGITFLNDGFLPSTPLNKISPDARPSHQYFCYSKDEGGKIIERIAECKGDEPDFFSKPELGGSQHSGGSITDKDGNTKICCDDAEWHPPEHIGTVPDCGGLCEDDGGKIAIGGEGNFGSYSATGDPGCCEDSPAEKFTDSSSFNPSETGKQACCKSDQDKCVYNNECHDKSAGETSCYDGIDNDCDDDYDFAEVLPKLVEVTPSFKPPSDSRGADNDCLIHITGSVKDSGVALPEDDAEVIITGTFNKPYDGKQPKFTYSDFIDENGFFDIQVNGDSAYDITIISPGREPKVITRTTSFDIVELGDIELGIEHDFCKSDCTNLGDNLCNKECDSRLGSTPHEFCNFAGPGSIDNQAKKDEINLARERCHERRKGHSVKFEGDDFISCCESTPAKKSKVQILLDTDCDVISTTKLVTLYGQPIKMVVDTVSC